MVSTQGFSVRLVITLLGVGALAPLARGEEPPPVPSDGVTVWPVGFKEGLRSWHVEPSAWVEMALTATAGSTDGKRTGHFFDDKANGFLLNQVFLGAERLLTEEKRFDVGGAFGLLVGSDARYTHTLGFLDEQGDSEVQVDLIEVYVSARIPVAEGLKIRFGRWQTPAGYEYYEAPKRQLYSESFLFDYSLPATHVGFLFELAATTSWVVSYGLMLGWDVWEDNNDSLSHYAGLAWTSPSEKDSVVLNFLVGPEQPDDDVHLRGVMDGYVTHTWSDRFDTALNAAFGVDEGQGIDGDDATFWGIAGYGTWKLSSTLSATFRAEFFRDGDGTRLDAPASLGEATLGFDWAPFRCAPTFRVRPEVRWDHSFTGLDFDEGTGRDQYCFSLDFVWSL